MKVRLASAGWENFTGTFGFQATFTNGLSDNELNARQIARIGSSVRIVNAETGEQVGPAEVARLLQGQPMTVAGPTVTLDQVKVDEERERQHLIEQEKLRDAKQAQALADAQQKAEETVDQVVIYSRTELEAIGANDGIQGLRDIAKPLGVRGRAITEMVNEILAAQTKLAVA